MMVHTCAERAEARRTGTVAAQTLYEVSCPGFASLLGLRDPQLLAV